MKCQVCGRTASGDEIRVYFRGPGGVQEGPFGPVITGNSMDIPYALCGRPTCEAEAVKSSLVNMGPGWERS